MRHLLFPAAMAVLSFLPGQGSAATVVFSAIPLPPLFADRLVPSVTQDIVTVTGNGQVFLNGSFGIGINDGVVDGTDIMTVSFSRPVTGITYNVDQSGCSLGCAIGDPFGVRLIEAFGVGGVALGTVTQSGFGFADLSADLTGNPLVTAFTIRAAAGQFVSLGSVTYTVAPEEPPVVPLPASLPLVLAGLAAFGLVRARKARAA